MINKIDVIGYKSIKKLELKLTPINVLIGANGVGKSNFISLFKLIYAVYDQRLENFSMIEGADSLLNFGRKNTEKIYTYIEFDEKNAYGIMLNSTNDNKLFVEEEKTYFNKSKGGRSDLFGSGWTWTMLAANSKEGNVKKINSGIPWWINLYLESFKIYHFHDTSKNAPLRSSCPVNDNKVLKENGSNLPAYLYYLQERENKQFQKIERAVKSIAPFFERFDLKPDRLNPEIIRLEWIEKNHPESYFDAKDFSDGTIRFIALATLLLQPNLPKSIIIDEPELGLHPFAINKLAGLIRKASASSQIIVSTQSINLVDNFSPNDIITVDRIDDQSVFRRLERESLNDWMDKYSLGDLWTKNVIGGQP